MKLTFQEIGTAAGALVEEKNRAYGSSFSTAGAAMQLLYPNGISPSQMADALVIVRIWDKLMRIATDRDALGESPYGDIIGYGILGVSMHQKEQVEAWPGSANVPDAPKPSPAPHDSVAQEIRPKTTAIGDESSELPNSRNSEDSPASSSASASTSSPASVPALTATENVNANAAVLVNALIEKTRCVVCLRDLEGRYGLQTFVGELVVGFCSFECGYILTAQRDAAIARKA